MNFNSKETYLTAVADWKLRFHTQIKKSRVDKVAFKEAQRAFSKGGGDKQYDYKWPQPQKDLYRTAYNAQEDLRLTIQKNHQEVTKLQIERANGKIEAGRQMEAARIQA
jgi:hypothetical protein